MTDQITTNGMVMSWTEERVQLLRKLWDEGLSASHIAKDLGGGVTRNAVIGKVHRLGLSGRVKPQAAAATARARPKTQPGRPQMLQRPMPPMRGNTALAMQPRQAPMPVARDYGGDNVVPMTETVTIMELRETMCRWPVGDPASADFRYCGGKAPIGEGPYCAFHSRMAYQPSQDRRQRRSA